MMICLLHLQYSARYINDVYKFSKPTFAPSGGQGVTAQNYYNILMQLARHTPDPAQNTVHGTDPAIFQHQISIESLLKDAPKPLRVFFFPACHQPAVTGGVFLRRRTPVIPPVAPLGVFAHGLDATPAPRTLGVPPVKLISLRSSKFANSG